MQIDNRPKSRKTLFIGLIAALAGIGLAVYFSIGREVVDPEPETAPETIRRFSKPDSSVALKELFGIESSGGTSNIESGEQV